MRHITVWMVIIGMFLLFGGVALAAPTLASSAPSRKRSRLRRRRACEMLVVRGKRERREA
jgi:hypothetical protein